MLGICTISGEHCLRERVRRRPNRVRWANTAAAVGMAHSAVFMPGSLSVIASPRKTFEALRKSRYGANGRRRRLTMCSAEAYAAFVLACQRLGVRVMLSMPDRCR